MSLPPHHSRAAELPVKAGSRGLRGRHLGWGSVVFLVLMIAGGWWYLLAQIVPKIDTWRADLAQQASTALGMQVRIGRAEGRASGLWPEVTLRQVELLDKDGRAGLTLPEITARLSPATLWPSALIHRQIHIDRLILVRPELDIRRDAQGRLHVASIEIGQPGVAPGGGAGGLDWLLDQERVRIDGGLITWTDELRQSPPLRLAQVNLTLRNRQRLTQRLHDWTLEATPPPEFGDRLRLEVHLQQPYWSWNRRVRDASQPWWQFVLPAPAGDWSSWSGNLQLDLPRADVQTLRRHVSLPFDIRGGHGRLALNLGLEHGQARQMILKTELADVSVRLSPDLEPLAFQKLAGTVSLALKDRQAELNWQGLTFTTQDGLSWPASRAALVWRHERSDRETVEGTRLLLPDLAGLAQAQGTGGSLEIEHLDVALLASLADRLPLPPHWRQTLKATAPQGLGQGLKLGWEGDLQAPVKLSLQGQFRRLGWMAVDGRPGLHGADLTVRTDERGGEAELGIRDGWLEFPGAFEEPRIPVDSLSTRLNWTRTPASDARAPAALTVNVVDARFANADARGQASGQWQTGPGERRFPGRLALKGTLAEARADRVWRYLPLPVGDEARHYVRDAVKGGVSQNTTFELQGPLDDFPFANAAQGRFLIRVPVRQVTLHYVPEPPPTAQRTGTPGEPRWPAFANLEGLLVFEGPALRIENATARLDGVGTGRFELRKVQGEIADLGADDPVLTIQGQGEGPLDDLLRFVAISPVNLWTDQVLADARGQGQAGLDLSLKLPLNQIDEARVEGTVGFLDRQQSGLKLAAAVPWLQNLRGQIRFSQDSLNVSTRARVFGQEVQIGGGNTPGSLPRFNASGSLSADGLRNQNESPLLARLASRLQGQTPVQVSVALTKGRPQAGGGPSTRSEINVSSNFQGLQMNLPAPLTKDAATPWPTRFALRNDDPDGRRDSLTLDLTGPGLFVKADWRRLLAAEHGMQVQRGTLSVVQAGSAPAGLPLPATGVQGRLQVKHLDVDGWVSLMGAGDAIPAPTPVVSGMPPQAGAASAAAGGAPDGDDFLPTQWQVRAEALTLRQRRIEDLTATILHPDARTWKAQIESRPLAGSIEVRPDPNASGPRVIARLKRLLVPAAEADRLQTQATEQLIRQTQSPQAAGTVPALDIVIEQLEWRDLPLGRLELEAVNRLNVNPGSAPQPEWRLSRLNLGNADGQLQASGNWLTVGSGAGAAGSRLKDRSAFSFTLDLANSGNLLNRLGMPQTLKGGSGKLTGRISWQGSPLEPDPTTMDGEMQVLLNEGQFLKVEPGVGRLLGVLSLQALPRRLLFDFRDVFQTGFAFDRIDGDIRLQQGVASTRNLRMRGVQAVVLMEGQADLRQETQNLRVFVVPELNAGTASLAYAAINPAIGLGTFIAQLLLRKTVEEANTREFTVTGSWSNPVVERVQRSGLPGSDATASPAPAASAPQAKQP